MDEDRIPTIREVAAACGLSRSTVSAALNDRADIAEATRDRVQRVAREMGYKRDAHLGSLMGYLGARRGRRSLVGVVLLYCQEEDRDWAAVAWNKAYLEGLHEAADHFGFRVTHFNVSPYVTKGRRLASILKARGIRGIILDSTVEPLRLEASLLDFHGVRLVSHHWESRFHTVIPDFAHNMHLALTQAEALGYRRPGVALIDSIDRRTEHQYLSQFLYWQTEHLPRRGRAEPLVYSYMEMQRQAGEPLVKWVKQHQIDLLLVNDRDVLGFLEGAGLQVPEEIGLVHLNYAEDVADWSAVDQSRRSMGRAAVEILNARISTQVRLSPEPPRTSMVRGEWHDGRTTSPRARASS